MHGNQSCTGHFISFLLQAYGRAVPVYIPVYLAPALVVHRQDLMKRYTIIPSKLTCDMLGNQYFLLPKNHVQPALVDPDDLRLIVFM